MADYSPMIPPSVQLAKYLAELGSILPKGYLGFCVAILRAYLVREVEEGSNGSLSTKRTREERGEIYRARYVNNVV